MAVIITAIAYFVTVFAFAFAMGVARTLVIAPLIGTTAAVLVEVPILLAASWVIARASEPSLSCLPWQARWSFLS
jgi:hypothetical protein